MIAILSSIAFPDPKDSFENNSLTEVERLMVFYDIYWYQVDKKDTFYRHFEFNAKYFEDEFNFYLRVNYAELDTGATNYMARNALPITKGDSIRPYSESTGSKAILFLEGVDASLATVSTHLNDMFQQSKKGLFADAAFLPNGSVEDFPSMKHYQKAIRQGQYSHVFVNGFYETDDCSTALGLLKECCAASNTELVLFPSYSESWDIIDEAREFHPDIPLLDWKAEMHRLITSGISVSDLCYPSFRNTTNEVGGYSGAHLVYRTLFRERPPMVSENSSFYQAIKRIYPAEYFNKDGSESLFGGKTYPIQ